MSNCDKCSHTEDDHRDHICHGSRFCLCIKYVSPKIDNALTRIPMVPDCTIIHTRTRTPLPQFITTHDNWGGNGWEYRKKWGRTQSGMVEYLSQECGLYEDEIRKFLRCRAASVRGRLSEINSRKMLKVNNTYH